MYNYSNYYTILNIVAQCFRVIHILSEKNQNKERKSQIRQGYELSRITEEVTDSMTDADQKNAYYTINQGTHVCQRLLNKGISKNQSPRRI